MAVFHRVMAAFGHNGVSQPLFRPDKQLLNLFTTVARCLLFISLAALAIEGSGAKLMQHIDRK